MQTRANTKAVNPWFLILYIVLIFLYFIGYVLGLGTKSCKFSTCGSFFCFCTSYRLIYGHQLLLLNYSFKRSLTFSLHPSPFRLKPR